MVSSFSLALTFLGTIFNSLVDDIKKTNLPGAVIPFDPESSFIQGNILLFDGGRVDEYLGIPYAKPPVGKLRFKPPVPIDTSVYGGRFLAIHKANSCYQKNKATGIKNIDIFYPKNNISEDCLQLNIWVPEKRTGAVIIFIHGGEFTYGSGSLDVFNGSYLAMKSQAIIVNVNYRLGAFGFSGLHDAKTIPVNMGLLDQQVAIKWVYERIGAFGGNQNQITLLGHGSGAICAAAHLFSRQSGRYIRRAILNSGSFKSHWGIMKHTTIVSNTKSLAKKLKCSTETNSEIATCFEKANALDIVQQTEKLRMESNKLFNVPFVISEHCNGFFEGSFMEKYENEEFMTNYEAMVGRSKDQGSLYLLNYIIRTNKKCKIEKIKSSKECTMDKKKLEGLYKTVYKQFSISKAMRKKFVSSYSSFKSSNKIASAILSDIYFECDWLKFAKDHSEMSEENFYSYVFDYIPSSQVLPSWVGVTENSNIELIFGYPFRKPSYYDKKRLFEDKKTSFRFMEYIGKFAAKGEPIPGWEPFRGDEIKSAIISFQNDSEIKKYKIFRENPRCKFYLKNPFY
uniref:Acetylcholinesterase n=1 Tax=Parastrongyloides trichosuri TaxID=131310 RepID=A0A0N4ZKT8_PARTI